MAKSVGNIRLLPRCSTSSAATRWSCTSPAATTASRWPSRTSAWRRRRARVARIREAGRRLRAGRLAGGPGAAARALLRRAGRRLQHARGAGRACSSWVARGQPPRRGRRRRATCARCSACSGSRTCSTADGGRRPPEVAALAERARGRARGARLRRGRPPARRDRARGLGGPRRPGRPRARAADVIVYGRNAVREALRGPRAGAARCGRPARGARGRAGRRARVRGRRRRSSSARAGSRRPPGRRAREVDAYPYADAAALLAAPDPLIVALDEVTDPQNLGAVCRTRRVRGRDRRRDPRAPLGRGDAGGVQGVGRRGRAPPDRARAQPRRLPRRRQGGGLLVLRRRRRARAAATTRPDYRGGRRARARRGGPRACARASPTRATSWSRCRCAGGSNRST